jgi:putative nucleotidyltransferase with HDIG domain
LSLPQLNVVVDSMVDSVCRNREAITWLARMKTKDDYLYNHSLASSVWALVLGRHIGLDRELLKALSLGAMMFDVGKTRLRTEFLVHPGKLSAEQMAEARRHVEHGLDILRETKGVDERVISMVATHHERYDGSGYPLGLSGDAIPLLGRIAGIVDCYDAMTSKRAYASAMSTYDAVRQMKVLSGTWFHPQLVEQFIQAVGVFPTGSLVELNTGEVGVVISQNRYRRLRPELMLILDENKQLRDDFATIDLTVHGDGSDARPKMWITRGLEPGSFGIDPTEYFL